MYLLRADRTSKAVHFIQPFLLMSSLMAESITQGLWRKVPGLVTSKHPPEYGLWRVFRVTGVIQCCMLCGQDDHCNSFQYTFPTRMCSGFLGRARASDFTERRVVSYVRSEACPTEQGYLLHSTITGLPLCFKYFTDPVKWPKARERCHADEAELIVLDTGEKDALIVQFLDQYSGRTPHLTWVGMVQEYHGKIVYKWLNNSTHIRWGPDEPDISAGQKCGQLEKAGMTDMYCYEKRRFICEKQFT